MKKLISYLVLFAVIMGTVAFSGFSVMADNGGTLGNLTWSLDGDGLLTISGEGEMILTNSSSAWKSNKDAVKHVIIKNGVTSIDGDAFAFCTALKSVSIPGSVTTIGGFAFIGCTALEEVVIPEGVTTIGNSAFRECEALKYVNIPASVTSIGIQAFNFNKSLVYIDVDDANPAYCDVDGVLFNNDKTTLIQYPLDRRVLYYTVPDEVTKIETYAFSYCANIMELNIPDSVTTIVYQAFSNSNVISITLNKGLSLIQEAAFDGVTSLDTINYCGSEEEWAAINIGDSNEGIDNASIVYNYDPKAVDKSGTWGSLNWVLDVSGTLTISGEGAMNDFEEYTSEAWRGHGHSIYNIVIEDGVTSIGDNAFNELMLLNSITIGSGVTEIDDNFLYACYYCANITVSKSNDTFCSVDGVLFNKDKTTLIKYAVNNPDPSYNIPTGVTTIADNAFTGCIRVLDVTIPDGVTYIGDVAFANCCEMESINIPEGVTYIGRHAFSNCYQLTSVTIPDSVTTVGESAFGYCYNLADVTIGKGITTLPKYMFAVCGDITSITIPSNITKIEDYAFYGCSSLKTFYYKGTEEQWNKVTIGNNDCIWNGKVIFDFVLGDVNGDGEADNTDALLILKYDAGLIDLNDTELFTGDVDGDGASDNFDALAILKYDAGIFDSLPPRVKTNYALGKVYTLTRDNIETDPNNLYLDYANGKTQWSDLSLTKMTDGIVGDITNEEYYSFYALPNVTVQLVGTNRIFSYIIDLGENYDDISSFVFRNVRDGVHNGNNRGFKVFLAYVSDDCENWTRVTGTESNTSITDAPVIKNNYNPEITGVEHVDVTYTLDTPAAGRYVKIYLTSDGGYVTQLEEIEIWN